MVMGPWSLGIFKPHAMPLVDPLAQLAFLTGS